MLRCACHLLDKLGLAIGIEITPPGNDLSKLGEDFDGKDTKQRFAIAQFSMEVHTKAWCEVVFQGASGDRGNVRTSVGDKWAELPARGVGRGRKFVGPFAQPLFRITGIF